MPDSIQPTNPEVSMPQNSSYREAKAAIEAKIADKFPAPPEETKEMLNASQPSMIHLSFLPISWISSHICLPQPPWWLIFVLENAIRTSPDQYLTARCPTHWTDLDTPCPDFQKYLFTCMDEDQKITDFLVRLFWGGGQYAWCEAARKMRMSRKRNENVPQHFFSFGTIFILRLRAVDQAKFLMISSGDLRFLPLLQV